MRESLPVRDVRFIFGVLAALAFLPCLAQELPPEIQVDQLMVQAEREGRRRRSLVRGDHAGAEPGNLRGARPGDSCCVLVSSGARVSRRGAI